MIDWVGIAAVISACTGLVTAMGVIGIAILQRHQGKKLEVVHTLVNSGMSEQLRIGMVSARALATLTNDPKDLELANTAESKYRVHEEKQRKADGL